MYLLASPACLGVFAAAAGVVQVDLVFPRNETYAPTRWMPVVFAVQNTELAPHIYSSTAYHLADTSGSSANISARFRHDLENANMAGHEPYFAYTFFDNFEAEVRYKMVWQVYWASCNEDDSEPRFALNSSNQTIEFTVKNDAQAVDLVAATANDKTCPPELGVAVNATGETMEVPSRGGYGGGTCAVLASSAPSPAPDPCRVKIDSTGAGSISATWTARMCDGTRNSTSLVHCPKDSAAQQLAVAGVVCFTVSLGAIGFLLV
jgi:hypothetical protein